MFKRLHEAAETVTVEFEGERLRVPAGETVAAALLATTDAATRTTPVGGSGRAPYCMMGVCFDCLVEIDGVPNRQACMTVVRDGMRIRRQHGVRGLGDPA